MKVAEEPQITEKLEVSQENIIQLPLGLLGFEQTKRYVLLSNPGEAPFCWLQMLENEDLAFLVVPASVVEPDYRPELSEEDVMFLALEEPSDALIFNVVTLDGNGGGSVNLKGPIVLNRHTLVGKQVVPLNAAAYSIKQPLPTAE